MKKIGILIMLVGLITLASGGYLFLNDDGDKQDTPKEEDVDVKPYGGKDIGVNKDTFKSYSEYTNYDLTITSTSTTGGNTVEVNAVNKVDVKNSIIKTDTTILDTTSYYYYDVVNKLEYYSYDNVKWEKNANLEMALPDFSAIIDSVKNADDPIIAGDGSYQITSNIVENGVTHENVSINVAFTSDGYLYDIYYTITDTTNNTEVTVDYTFSNINSIGDIVIPNEIVTGATQGSATSSIYFLKLA